MGRLLSKTLTERTIPGRRLWRLCSHIARISAFPARYFLFIPPPCLFVGRLKIARNVQKFMSFHFRLDCTRAPHCALRFCSVGSRGTLKQGKVGKQLGSRSCSFVKISLFAESAKDCSTVIGGFGLASP